MRRIAPLALLAAALALLVAHGRRDDAPAGALGEARVVRIVDGDTIRVELHGREERVRYIGIDTPE